MLSGGSTSACRSGGSHMAQLLRVLGQVNGSEPREKQKEEGEMRGRGEGAAGVIREGESSRDWEQSVIETGEVGSGEWKREARAADGVDEGNRLCCEGQDRAMGYCAHNLLLAQSFP
ncbi:unnamed protein product [Closterium sp. NIES-64]|nr:unnamed protein product [Closterium sp. NIES-64]